MNIEFVGEGRHWRQSMIDTNRWNIRHKVLYLAFFYAKEQEE